MSHVSAAAWLLIAAACASAAEPLTSVGAVRCLPEAQAGQGLSVRLEAVVTYYHHDWGVMFVHDGGDGICVGVPVDRRPVQPFTPGTRLRIEGRTGPGEFLPVILPERIDDVGKAALPVYEETSVDQLFEPGMDCHPVVVEALVKSTWFGDQSLIVELQIGGLPVKAIMPAHQAQPQLPWQLLGHRVRAHGIAGTHFNDQRQMSGRLLFVQGVEDLRPVDAAATAEAAPVLAVDALLRADSPLRQRVRVRGIVTHVALGRGLYLRGQGGSMFVQTAQPLAISTGDAVEAEGYPVITAFRPSLSAIHVRKEGRAAPPAPAPFHAARTRHSSEQCELITLDASLLEITRFRTGASLTCGAEGQAFEAALPAHGGALPILQPGMKLRLTGICEFVSTHPLHIPRNATGFTLQLRSPADVVVLERPPWWTLRHALWALGILGLLALAVGAWAVSSQFVVHRQSAVIRQQAQAQAVLEERQRIARDLHDTLEQELVGVTMLLDSAAMRLNGSTISAVTEPLGLARRLLRRVRAESRSTIQDLRSVTLEQRGLPAAMDELLRPLAAAAGADFQVRITGAPARLPGTMETHLLRLAQEAVANAARHARARTIILTLDYRGDEVLLQITDDGCGFDPAAAAASSGHFGLSGMRERAEKISGHLHISSQAGQGATVVVRAPLAPAASTHET